jgi:hypothetical protein
MNKLTLPIATLISCSLLFAEEISSAKTSDAAQEKPLWEFSATTSAAYYPEASHKTGSSHFSGMNGIYDGAKAVVEFDAAYTLPFLRGNDEFTADNHIVFNTGLEVTPVSVAPVASITISPIAFLELAIGGTIGTGWSIGDLFQGMAKFNEAKPEYKNLAPFAHWYLYGWAKATLMFDLAALWEGDWHHVVATATYTTGYQNITGTDADIWLWQADEGLASGWIYEQEYFIGYQMPLNFSMVGFGVTLSGHYRSSDYGVYSSNYKGDFITIDIWPMAEITLSKKDKLYILADFEARRSFREKYKDVEHEPMMTYCGREWIFYALGFQWKHLF